MEETPLAPDPGRQQKNHDEVITRRQETNHKGILISRVPSQETNMQQMIWQSIVITAEPANER